MTFGSTILKYFRLPSVIILFLFPFSSCMKWEYGPDTEDFNMNSKGLFILCEGNFQYGNSTLSYYDPLENQELNEVFYKANGMKLGDVAQSMSIYENLGWIVVNNSHVVFAIDLNTFKEKGRIENLTSPRYIHFVNPEKAYVSQLWDNRIFIVNPKEYKITGYIEVPDMRMGNGSTEQMIQIGQYVYCTCWSYQNKIIKIDTANDKVVDSIEVGLQPSSLVADKNGKLWTLTDGGYEGSPIGFEAPALYCIDPESFSVDRIFSFYDGDDARCLIINKEGSCLYWINDDIWKMDIESERLPVKPFVESIDTKYFSITVSPENEDIYVADAIDYQQQGKIYRFSNKGELLYEFYTGVNPGAFCWK